MNELLKLLNLNFDKSGFLTDFSNNSKQKLSLKDDYYEYIFTRNEIKYTLRFNDQELILTNDHETITINRHGFIYSDKKPNSDKNDAYVSITEKLLAFYLVTNLGRKQYASTGVKANTTERGFIFLKISEDFKYDDVHKEDTTIYEEDDKAVVFNNYRTYNSLGILSAASNKGERKDTPVSDLIINKINHYPSVNELLERVESMYPNITEYLVTINPNLQLIIAKNKVKEKEV